MSTLLAESNEESSKDLFEKRNYYRSLMTQRGRSATDFNFGEKYFYGRVDRNFIPIVLDLSLLRNFNASMVEAGTLSDVHFVVRAFGKISQQFKKCAAKGLIVPNDPYLTTLRIYQANENHEQVYSKYLQKLLNEFRREVETQDIQVRNFSEFMEQFLRIMREEFSTTPFTKTGFIKSAECPANVSGLTLEIADKDIKNDVDKINLTKSPNWRFFLNACRSYGFMVDQNIPWRMVADIGSAPMLEYARADGLNSTDQILRTAYNYVHDEYFPKFAYYLFNLYNEVRLRGYIELNYCGNRTTVSSTDPQYYTKLEFESTFSEKMFLHWYCRLRLSEEKTQLREEEQSILIDDILEIYLTLGVSESLRIFEFIINKPFDYSGSLSYINRKLEAIDDKKVAELGKANPRSASTRGGGSSGGPY